MREAGGEPALARLVRARLGAREKAAAELVFAAMIPGEAAGLPRFDAIDRGAFWRCIDEAPGPTFGVGLRVMVHAMIWLPVFYAGYRRPLHALPPERREAFVAQLADDPRYLVRQLVAALKTLACFAYFDAPAVRARLERREAS